MYRSIVLTTMRNLTESQQSIVNELISSLEASNKKTISSNNPFLSILEEHNEDKRIYEEKKIIATANRKIVYDNINSQMEGVKEYLEDIFRIFPNFLKIEKYFSRISDSDACARLVFNIGASRIQIDGWVTCRNNFAGKYKYESDFSTAFTNEPRQLFKYGFIEINTLITQDNFKQQLKSFLKALSEY